MKKVLALVLCVLMLSTSLVFSTSAAVAADYDFRKVVYDAGYGAIVPNVVATAPVIDGVVSEGEYTVTDEFTKENGGLALLQMSNAAIVSLKMSYAHDLQYVYVAVEQETNTAQWTTQFLNLQLGARNKAQGLWQDVWGNRLDMSSSYNDDGTPVLVYNENGEPYTRYNDTSYQAHKTSLFYYGPNYEYGKDVETKMAFSNENKVRTQEYKLSKDYLKAINSANQYKFENNVLVDTSAGDAEEDNAFLAIQWLVNSQYGLYYAKPSAEMTKAATDAGDATGGWFAWPVYFVDYDFREQQIDLGTALFAGAKRSAENAPVLDGVIGADEYNSSITYTTNNLPATIINDAQASMDLESMTMYAAHDGANVYVAIKTVKNNTPTRIVPDPETGKANWGVYDRFNFQFTNFDKANNTVATNFETRAAVHHTRFDNADGTISNLAEGNPLVAGIFKHDYATGGKTAIYELKFDLGLLDAAMAKVYATGSIHDTAPAMTEADLGHRDTFFLMINPTNTNKAGAASWVAPNGTWLFMTNSNIAPITDIVKMLGHKTAADVASSYTVGWGYTPIFLFENNAPATSETASVRISGVNDGLRFQTKIAEWDLQELVNKYGYSDVQVGTLIAPADKLGDKALTHEFGKAGVDYLDVKADIANPFAKSNCVYTFAGSITNIKADNLDRDFVAVGYIAYTNAAGETTYIYSASAATRNVSAVATAALADETANYTETQKTILGNLVVAK